MDILVRRHLPTLASFASSNVVVAFDYDGTLAPVVNRPALARMRRTTRRLLTGVARRYPCAVISGRSLADLTPRIGRIPVWHIIGNHGVEPWEPRAAFAAAVRTWLRQLEPRLNLFPGVVIEDKTFSLTLHYRQARHRQEALEAIMDAVGVLDDARTIESELAINVLPRDAPGKGAALERVRRALACHKAIYVGNDDADEEAFGAASPDRLLAVRIGKTPHTRATYRLKNQSQIDVFLEALLQCRPAGPRALSRTRRPAFRATFTRGLRVTG
jgi:trehalose 6-phosphate phosphatase